MKNIYIKKISIKNFGGIATGEYLFDKNNIIEGASGSGKTSAYSAYLWALGFTIPNWEPQIDGYRLYKTKTEVQVELDVDGVTYTIAKTNSPKYKINKFTAEEEYSGSDFKYIYDGQVSSSYNEYKEKISSLFDIDYFTLELLSDISLFNGEDNNRWNKNERRKFLFKLFDLENKILELSNEEEFACLKEYIDKGKDELEINQTLNTLKTNIEKEINSSQVIIEEKQRELSEYNFIDFEELENKKNKLHSQISEISTQQKESARSSLSTEIKEKISILNTKLTQIQNNNDNLERDWQRQINECDSKLKTLDMDIDFSKSIISQLENENEDYKIESENIQEENFCAKDLFCPTCKQTLPQDKIDEMESNFKKSKEERLVNISQKAENNAEKIKTQQEQLNTLLETQSAVECRFCELKDNPPQKADTKELTEEIQKLEKQLSEIDNANIDQEVESRLNALNLEYENTIKELTKRESKNKIAERIEELKTRIRELGIQDAERIEKKNALQKYTQRKVNMVNDEVNKHFIGVKYNFFKWNSSSAGREYQDVCEAVLAETGTEYGSLSSGQKVKVDLLTNNSLRKILNVNIPQFIDDVVLSDLEKVNQSWQTVYLLTNNEVKPKNISMIKDCFSIKDCDVRR